MSDRESYDEFIRTVVRQQSREQIERQVKKSIWVTFQKEGIHKYPNAPDEVEFLRYPHRHIFKFKVQIEVYNDDRDIEFFIFKRWLESLYTDDTLELDYKSCEMIADDLAKEIKDKYSGRWLAIDVSEDGENGCHIEYPKEY
tara:strand:+ start:820 stop:1245 length:426 start_codon:yes stop_codon:yes gene_type:complete